MTTAIYAGSFDVLTNGHRWMIARGSEIFDHLVVAIGDNPAKRPWFTVEERIEMLGETLTELAAHNIRIDSS
ncbi:MAG: adenylyltransferase/cytidyltransferase family protein [Patescibacteria group bacterium]